ncbi:hypothetical protein D0Y65_008504 [Glycine soja]|uniref:DDE Tnp4 domain-containing protein n=1 Tax=Glycine soja TaxID=3848 RepID=A0A445KUA4_GLYSO|nr:hypothetical protein D0Y65_008504 [Glycine soja]
MNRGLRDANGSLSKQNVERIILPQLNAKTKFMYVLSGWEGSAHDSKVLSDALARKNGLKVPQGHGNDPENEKELFNLRHASLRNVIERIFVEPTDESSSSSSVLPNYEDNDHEPIVQTQEQERGDANIWRTNIGSDMWRNANN